MLRLLHVDRDIRGGFFERLDNPLRSFTRSNAVMTLGVYAHFVEASD